MKSYFLNVAVLFFFLGLIASCSKMDDSSGCSNNTGWIITGHEWVYDHYSDYISADSLFVSVTAESDGAFTYNSTYDDGSLYPTFTSYLQPCGNDIYSAKTVSMADKFIVYKTDGNIGDKWSYTGTTTGGYAATAVNEITGKNITVSVTAGAFQCLKIHQVLTSSQPSSIPVVTDFYLNNQYGIIQVDGSTTQYNLVRKNF